MWELLLRMLAPAPPPPSEPGEMETILKRILSMIQAPESKPEPANSVREVGLRLSSSSPHKDWTRLVRFSCGRPDHVVNRCPQRDKIFPYLLPGCTVEHRDGNIWDYPVTPSVVKRRLIREGGGGQSPGSVIQVDP